MYTIGENAGIFLNQVLRSWKGRIGLAIFGATLCVWGWWSAFFLTLLYIGILRLLRGKEATQVGAHDTTHGSARWANNNDLFNSQNLTLRLQPDRYLLGVSLEPLALKKKETHIMTLTTEIPRRGMIGLPLVVTGSKDLNSPKTDDGHLLTIAGAGAGKGVSVVKPNLMAYQGSIVAFDPKGENFLSTYKHRLALGHRVCLVDPFNTIPADIRAEYQVQFNPLELLSNFHQAGNHSDVYDEATAIADFIVLTTAQESQPHFNEKAKAFIRSAIMFVVYADVYQDRTKYPLNLVTVKDCILHWFSSPEKMKVFTEICNNQPQLMSVGGAISMIAGEERQSVLSTVLRHTEFLDSQNVRQSLSLSDFNLNDLKDVKLSIFLVLPANRIKSYSRLARVWIGSLLQSMMSDMRPLTYRVLFMLDEIGQLGHLDVLLGALTLGRDYGIDIWCLFQDMGQIKSSYGESWVTFFANCKYKQFFGVRDQDTAKYVSDLLGKQTIGLTTYANSTSKSQGSNSGHTQQGEQWSSSGGRNSSINETESITISSTGRELLQPNEVMRLPESELIVFIGEQHPVLAQKYDTRDQFFLNGLETVAVEGSSPQQARIMG